MLPSPKIVVMDDNPFDIEAILEGLQQLGTVAVGLLYDPEVNREIKFPCLRLLFLDLYLSRESMDPQRQIKNTIEQVARLIDQENGPYAIVLWSQHAEEIDGFRREIGTRLSAVSLPSPLSVVSLSKSDHIDPSASDKNLRIRDPKRLGMEIAKQIQDNPQLAALISWEEHVSRAADETIRQIFKIASRPRDGRAPSSSPTSELNRVLGEIAVTSAGLENAREDPFRATNDVLGQVLIDRLIHRSASEDVSDLWSQAVTSFEKASSLSEMDAAEMNRFLHFEMCDSSAPSRAHVRGSVVDISSLSDTEFADLWGLTHESILGELKLDRSSHSRALDSLCRVMIQIQAPCDQAQRRSGLLPYVLGVGMALPSNNWLETAKKRVDLWVSPSFLQGETVHYLVFHFRFMTGLPRQNAEKFRVRYRLREQLLSDLTHQLHGYGGRPGFVKFPR